MIKPFVVINTFDEFKNLKLSIDDTNTTYITYLNNIQTYGSPNILWDQIVFILDVGMIYCKGKIFTNFNDIINKLNDLDTRLKTIEDNL